MTKLLLTLAAFAAGSLLSVQAGINAQLARGIGAPLVAAMISFAVGLVLLVVAGLVARVELPAMATLRGLPVHVLVGGGLIGATYVLSAILLAPRLGAGVLVALVVAGQISAALVLDQFGLVGFPEQALTPGRAIGAVLLVVGVVLVRFF